MSIWCLTTFRNSKNQVHIGLRDRCMLLLSTTTAFWGDSSCQVLWSDLLSWRIPMMDISMDSHLTICTFISPLFNLFTIMCVTYTHDGKENSLYLQTKPRQILVVVLMNMVSFDIVIQSSVALADWVSIFSAISMC